jgi:hypothetical protein
VAEYPRAISVGIALLDPIVNQLPRRGEKAAAMEISLNVIEKRSP